MNQKGYKNGSKVIQKINQKLLKKLIFFLQKKATQKCTKMMIQEWFRKPAKKACSVIYS